MYRQTLIFFSVAGLTCLACVEAKFILTRDGTEIFYKDWGSGQPVVFTHGFLGSADDMDEQMFFFTQNGFRAIGIDRRSHGRSTQTSQGNNMDTYADDLAAVMNQLNVQNAFLVGFSTGGGEIARYMSRHGTSRVAKAVFLSAVVPHLAQTPSNPEGLPASLFDLWRTSIINDRSQMLNDNAPRVYGYNRPGSNNSLGVRDRFWLIGMQGGVRGLYDCIEALSETDFTEDLRKIDKPVLFLHGGDDQIMPVEITANKAAKLVRNSTIKVYPGYPHGMHTTHHSVINADLLNFARISSTPNAATGINQYQSGAGVYQPNQYQPAQRPYQQRFQPGGPVVQG